MKPPPAGLALVFLFIVALLAISNAEKKAKANQPIRLWIAVSETHHTVTVQRLGETNSISLVYSNTIPQGGATGFQIEVPRE